MSENPCAAFFRERETDRELVAALPSVDECVAWEAHSASPDHSREGPVRDHETLRRRIITPTHLDPSGQPTPACFKDAWDKGLSVDRGYRPENETIRDAEAWVATQPNADKRFHGLATVEVADLRGVTLEGQRAFAIFDTAMSDNDAHADVCGIGKPNKTHRTDLRATLWSKFKKSWLVA